MFKTKEELKKEIEREAKACKDVDAVMAFGYVEDGINEAFESFAERVEFYKKYEGLPITFFDTQMIEEWEKFKKWHNDAFACLPCYKDTIEGQLEYAYVFSRWLFDYCFGDVIE